MSLSTITYHSESLVSLAADAIVLESILRSGVLEGSAAYIRKSDGQLYFHCESCHRVQSLSSSSCHTFFIQCLFKQMIALKEMGYVFYGFDPDDVIVVDDIFFLFTNGCFLSCIEREEQREEEKEEGKAEGKGEGEEEGEHEEGKKINKYILSFYCPFKKPTFCSPELACIHSLPASVHWKTCFYSFALLLQSLLKDDVPRFTKLYWFLERCMKNAPASRKMIYI